MLETGREDPSGAESDTSHGSPRPHEPWVSDHTSKSEHNGGGDGLIEESERVDETLHARWGSSVCELVCCYVDKELSDSRRSDNQDWHVSRVTSRTQFNREGTYFDTKGKRGRHRLHNRW